MISALLLLLALPAHPPRLVPQPRDTASRVVLVTGASSGIGRRITESLAAAGHTVFAGARKPEDLAELARIPRVRPLRLDVTSASDIASAVDSVRRLGRGLHGLVNNAGIATLGPLVALEEREMLDIFNVNVLGPWRMTKAFASLLVASKGRVATISSISGIHSGPLLGAYSMTKHAIEAFGDALGAEMARLGVHSALIEPGNYKSEIGRNSMPQLVAAVERTKGTPFEQAMAGLVNTMSGYDAYPEPTAVADAVAHALLDAAPRPRYLVVPVARQAEGTIRRAMLELLQMNQGHSFTLSRDALIAMMDQLQGTLVQPPKP